FHLHLLKLARAEDEVSRRDLVAKRLANLRDAERNLATHRGLHVQKIDKDSLRRFRTQIRERCGIVFRRGGAERRAKHHVEVTLVGKVRRTAVSTLDEAPTQTLIGLTRRQRPTAL